MSIDDRTLQVEITIAPAKGSKGGRLRSPAVPKVPDAPRIPRITRLMALAIKFQDMVDRGEVRDYADLARLGYVSRARVTQIMNLLNLHPDIQEQLLFAAGTLPAEHGLRSVTTPVDWPTQLQLWSHFSLTDLAPGKRKALA